MSIFFGKKKKMNLLLRLRRHLPREIIPEVFFLLHPPSEKDILDACRDGKSLLVERCIFHNLIDIEALSNLPLCMATKHGHTNIISLLLPLYANDAYPNLNVPLAIAAKHGNYEIASILLDHGASATGWYNDPIILASQYGHIEIVSLLLDHGANPLAYNNQPLISAVAGGYTEMVSILLEYGADASAWDNYPLILATENGYSEIVSLLLAHGSG